MRLVGWALVISAISAILVARKKVREGLRGGSSSNSPEAGGSLETKPTDQGSSSSASPGVAVPPVLKELNDHVYELFHPPGRPSIEIVFFHGLQLEASKNVYITTWISRDGSLWLNWIVDAYPEARILIISYDASVKLTDDRGLTDMYITRENLFQDLTTGAASIGQDGCPVILVGHCVGGLVLKQVCVQARSIISQCPDKAAERLLNNIKGLFFYGSPHHGSQLADTSTRDSKGLLFQDVTTLNPVASRQNEEFRKLRNMFGWKAYGIGESLPVSMQGFRGLVVGEASARCDVDSFYTVHDDHFNMCRPASTKSSSFSMLSNLVADVLKEDKVRAGHKVDLIDEVVGLDKPVKKLVKRLKGETRLGIVGMGGLGKTTLAKALFNSISENFEYTCFMEDVKTKVESNVDPVELQGKITKNLYYKGKKVDQKVFSWSDLQRKRVLIVLDDVDCEFQFSVMTVHDGFANESRVIVTSRDKRLLEENDFDNCHFHKVLEDEDSRKLFCRHAFRTAVAPSGYEERVEKFVKKCGGLPLALKVGGKYLYNRKRGELWDDALEKLSNAQSLSGNKNDPLWSILEVTYASLAESEQEMFLDIATCFYGERLEDVKEAWRVCSWASADSGWVNLKDKGLVTTSKVQSEFKSDNYFLIQMHETLRDWGRKRAGQSRVSLHYLANDSWSFDEINPEVKVVKIVCDTGSTGEREVLRGYGKSQLFIFEGSGAYFWDASTIIRRGCLGLEEQGEPFIGNEDLLALGEQLKHCSHLELMGCHSLHTLPASFGQLTALNHLVISGCDSLQSLPEGFGELKALSHLVIYRCRSLQKLPEGFGQLKALTDLNLESLEMLEQLPESFGQLKALTHLNLQSLKMLEQLPESFGQLTALIYLKINCCWSLRSLPEGFGELKALIYLDLVNCRFQNLPQGFEQLKALRHLRLEDLEDLEQLPESFGQFTALDDLEIWNCGLRSLPEGFGELKALSQLTLEGLDELEELPESFGQLTALNKLEIWNCGLRSLPEGFGELKALSQLKLDGLDELEELPESFGQLTALNCLRIGSCRGLRSLPEGFGQLMALGLLKLTHCCGLRSLPESFGELKALSQLNLAGLELEQLPESFGQLLALNRLVITNCDSLQNLPEGFGELRTLSRLLVYGCLSLQNLPESFGELKALSHLFINGCDSLQNLPEGFGELKALSHLVICGCDSLQNLPEGFGQLKALTDLDLESLEMLEQLPESFGQLTALNRLEIRGCNSLRSLCKGFGELKALSQLELDGCENLQRLPHLFGQLRALNSLFIQGCGNLCTLPESVQRLVSLRELTLPTKLKMAAKAFCPEVQQIAEFSDLSSSTLGYKWYVEELQYSDDERLESDDEWDSNSD